MSENPGAYQQALAACSELFQFGADVGFDFTLLDIGGGFPGEKHTAKLFNRMADAIKLSLSQHFSPSMYRHLRVIAEPGTISMCTHVTIHTYKIMHVSCIIIIINVM